MKLKDVNLLNQLLDTIKLKDFSIEDIKALLALKKETKTIVENTMELKIEVAKKYELIPNNGIYEYQGHPRQFEIESTMADIDKGPFELKSKTKFLTFDQLKSSLKDEHILDDILILSDYLVKD